MKTSFFNTSTKDNVCQEHTKELRPLSKYVPSTEPIKRLYQIMQVPVNNKYLIKQPSILADWCQPTPWNLFIIFIFNYDLMWHKEWTPLSFEL